MSRLVYYDGEFHPEETPLFSAKERAFLYGDGIFTSIKISHGFVEYLDAHLTRLNEQARKLNILFPLISPQTIRNFVFKQAAHQGAWRLKIIITGGTEGHLSLKERKGKVLMTLAPYEDCLPTDLKVGIFSEPIFRPFSKIKTLSYLDRLMLKQRAIEEGYDDLLTVSPKQELLEVSCGNFFWIEDHKFHTPSPELPLLYGITVQNLEKVANGLGFTSVHRSFHFKDISDKAHLYICNSLCGFRPVTTLKNQHFKRNTALEKLLQSQYRAHLQHHSFPIKE